VARGSFAVAVALLLLSGGASAWPPIAQDKEEDELRVELREVMDAPDSFEGHEISFEARFMSRGNLFKRFNTNFTRRHYNNFSVWPIDAELWDVEARRDLVPTLYLHVRHQKLREVLRQLKQYDAIEVKGTVETSYAGLPWIEVEDLRPVETESVQLSRQALVHVADATKLFNQGRYGLAEEQYRLAMEAGLPDVHMVHVHQRIARGYLRQRRYEDALEAFRLAEGYEPENLQTHIGRARALLRLGRPEAAMEACREVLRISGEAPLIHAMMGEALGLMGRTAQGLRKCALTIHTPGASGEDRAYAEVHRARVFVSADRFAEAIGAYARAIGENTPLAAEPWLRKEIGALYEDRFEETGKTEYLEEAIREYGTANVITRDTDPDALYLLARARYRLLKTQDSEDYQEVLELLLQARDMDPTFMPARLLRARILLDAGRTEEAEEILQSIAREYPDDPASRLRLAAFYKGAGRTEEALKVYREVVELDSASEEAWRNIAKLSEAYGDTAAARRAYGNLVEIDPTEATYRYHLARTSLEMDDYETAIAQSRAAIVPGDQGLDARMMLARALWADGKLNEAERVLRELLEEAPEHADALALRALLLSELEMDFELATDLARSALQAAPDSVMALDALAWAEFRLGMAANALETLEQIEESARTRSVRFHRGVILAELGRYEEATEALRRAAAPVRDNEMKGVAMRLQKYAQEWIKAIAKKQHQARIKARREEQRAARRKDRQTGGKPAARIGAAAEETPAADGETAPAAAETLEGVADAAASATEEASAAKPASVGPSGEEAERPDASQQTESSEEEVQLISHRKLSGPDLDMPAARGQPKRALRAAASSLPEPAEEETPKKLQLNVKIRRSPVDVAAESADAEQAAAMREARARSSRLTTRTASTGGSETALGAMAAEAGNERPDEVAASRPGVRQDDTSPADERRRFADEVAASRVDWSSEDQHLSLADAESREVLRTADLERLKADEEAALMVVKEWRNDFPSQEEETAAMDEESGGPTLLTVNEGKVVREPSPDLGLPSYRSPSVDGASRRGAGHPGADAGPDLPRNEVEDLPDWAK
jgi:tetratricopeptide (TPR) repeat protein